MGIALLLAAIMLTTAAQAKSISLERVGSYALDGQLRVTVKIESNLGSESRGQFTASIPELGVWARGPITLGAMDSLTRSLLINDVDAASLEHQYIRISVSAGNAKRVIYREIDW